jgi:hypothetical protein
MFGDEKYGKQKLIFWISMVKQTTKQYVIMKKNILCLHFC